MEMDRVGTRRSGNHVRSHVAEVVPDPHPLIHTILNATAGRGLRGDKRR